MNDFQCKLINDLTKNKLPLKKGDVVNIIGLNNISSKLEYEIYNVNYLSCDLKIKLTTLEENKYTDIFEDSFIFDQKHLRGDFLVMKETAKKYSNEDVQMALNIHFYKYLHRVELKFLKLKEVD